MEEQEEENVEELLYLNGEINDGKSYQMNLSEIIILVLMKILYKDILG